MPIVEGAEKVLREFEFHSVEESKDGRWYIIDGQRLMSTTTALKAIGKIGLVKKSAILAAEFAFLELPTLVAASRKKPCGNAYSRCRHEVGDSCEKCSCGECQACIQRWVAERHEREWARRADEGVRIHDAAEWWSYHGEIKEHDEDIAKYLDSFRMFVEDYGITPDDVLLAEALLVHRDIGAAGQTDGIIRLHAERSVKAAKDISRLTQVPWKRAQKLKLTADLLIDYKSRETTVDDDGEVHGSAQFFPDNALQIAGYRHFPVVRVKNSDHEEPLQPTDGGMVIQLRPDGYSTRLVICDKFTYENGFLPALNLYRWITEHGAASVSSHSFVLPETVAARARKAAKEQAAVSPATSTAA